MKLNPCSKCGGMPEIKQFSHRHTVFGEFMLTYQVKCKNCGRTISERTIFTMDGNTPKFKEDGYTKCVKLWNAE